MRTACSNVNYVECVEIVIRRLALFFDRKSLMTQPLSVSKPMTALQLDSFEVRKLVCFSRLGCLFDLSCQVSHSFPRRQ